MRATRVLILYNQPTLPADHRDADSEHEVLYTAEQVEKALAAAGYTVGRLAVDRDPAQLVGGIRKARPDVVFNLFEGLPDWGDTEAYAVNWARYWRDTLTYHTPASGNYLRWKLFDDWWTAQLRRNRPWNEVVTALLTASGVNDELAPVNFLTALYGNPGEIGTLDAVDSLNVAALAQSARATHS